MAHTLPGTETPQPAREADRRSVRKAITAAVIGNTVEWFDFAIYGLLATYIAKKFFPPGMTPRRCWTPSPSSLPCSSCVLSADSSSAR